MVRVYTVTPKKKLGIFSRFRVNTMLIISNVVLFVLFTIGIAIELIPIEFIAIKPANILEGKYLWTFLTSMFMHGGIGHLFMNMISLFFVGGLVERLVGPKRYFYFYLASGIFASLLFVFGSFIFVDELNAFAVGASGALFGLIGFLMIITPNLPVYPMFLPIPIKMKYIAPAMLVILWFVSLVADINIGNTAHLGGFIFGVIYALYIRSKYKNKTRAIQRHFS